MCGLSCMTGIAAISGRRLLLSISSAYLSCPGRLISRHTVAWPIKSRFLFLRREFLEHLLNRFVKLLGVFFRLIREHVPGNSAPHHLLRTCVKEVNHHSADGIGGHLSPDYAGSPVPQPWSPTFVKFLYAPLFARRHVCSDTEVGIVIHLD